MTQPGPRRRRDIETRHHVTLMETGQRLGRSLAPAVATADLHGRVSPANVHLCAALGALAVQCARALGATDADADRAGQAAATLSLVTKIDDQVIDGLQFHGGPDSPRGDLAQRCRGFLDATLRSIRTGAPATPEPRAHLAATLGRALVGLGPHHDRVEALLDEIAAGWSVQVEAVTTLSAHPRTVSLDEVRGVTTAISARWLRMITMVGGLARTAARPLTDDERDAFNGWGDAIQRADALTDLGKDLADGLVSSLPAWHLYRCSPSRWAEACRSPQAAYRAVAHLDLDILCTTPAATLDALHARQGALGAVPGLLRWIHGFLTWRYLRHPLCARAQTHPAFSPHLTQIAGWTAYQAAARGAPA